MATLTIPSFSLPITRTEQNALAVKLANDFEKQGFSVNDSKTMALQIITFKAQGLTDSQILKNFQDTQNFNQQKEAERQRQIEIEKAKQQPLLEQLAKEKAQREALAKARGDPEKRTEDEINNFGKTNIVLVANPSNPRGALIPLAEAQRIQEQLDLVGGLRTQDQFSTAQKNNPSIIESIRNLVSPIQKTPEVVAINRGFVQLSDGNLVERAKFTGKIPQHLLDAEKTPALAVPKTPDNAPFGGVTTVAGVTKVIDPTKTTAKATTTNDPSKIQTVERPITQQIQDQLNFLAKLNPKIDSKVFDPLGDLAKSLGLAFNQGGDALAKATNDIQKELEKISNSITQPKPDTTKPNDTTKPFDPIGDLQKFLSTFKFPELPATPPAQNPTTPEKPFDFLAELQKLLGLTPKAPEPPTEPKPTEPKPTDQSKPTPTPPTTKPTEPEPPTETEIPEPQKTILKIAFFMKEHGAKIAIGGISAIAIAGLALTILPKNNGILSKELHRK